MRAGYQLVIKEQNTKYNSKLRKHDPTDNIRNKNQIVRLPLTAGPKELSISAQNNFTPDLTLLAKKKKCNPVNSSS